MNHVLGNRDYFLRHQPLDSAVMMRFLLIIFLLFSSVAQSDEITISAGVTFCNYDDGDAPCQPEPSNSNFTIVVTESDCPGGGAGKKRTRGAQCQNFQGINNSAPYSGFSGSLTCTVSTVICKYQLPCPAAGSTAGIKQFPPNKHLTCVGGCGVVQVGESSCTGTLAEGGYCVADFDYTGSPCDPDDDLPDGDDGGDNGGDGDGDGDGGDGDGDGNGDGNGGDGDGDGDGGDGNGDGHGNGSGDGDGDGDTDQPGTAQQAENCSAPPVCDEPGSDACLAAVQSWRAICDFSTFNPSDLDGTGIYENTADKLYKEEDVGEIFSGVLNANPGPGGACPNGPNFRVGGMSYQFSYYPLCDFSLKIRPLIIAMSYLIAFFIVFG